MEINSSATDKSMNDIFRSWGILSPLDVPNWKLGASDLEFAKLIGLKLCELAETPETFPWLPESAISEVPGMMSRVLLYENDKIEIRAHVFNDGAEETYIHNHGQAFITTCLQGSYLHQLWAVNPHAGNCYYIHTRRPGGIYSGAGSQGEGFVECILSHEYTCGQSFYISPSAQHTVGGASNELVTLVLRDKQHKSTDGSTILSFSETMLDEKTAPVRTVTDSIERDDIVRKLCRALISYKNAQASIACMKANFADFSPLKVCTIKLFNINFVCSYLLMCSGCLCKYNSQQAYVCLKRQSWRLRVESQTI